MPRNLTIVAFSDTHGMHESMSHDIPGGNVLIHAGDFCGRGYMTEVLAFADWIGGMPHTHKLVIPGNHDRPVELSRFTLHASAPPRSQ